MSTEKKRKKARHGLRGKVAVSFTVQIGDLAALGFESGRLTDPHLLSALCRPAEDTEAIHLKWSGPEGRELFIQRIQNFADHLLGQAAKVGLEERDAREAAKEERKKARELQKAWEELPLADREELLKRVRHEEPVRPPRSTGLIT